MPGSYLADPNRSTGSSSHIQLPHPASLLYPSLFTLSVISRSLRCYAIVLTLITYVHTHANTAVVTFILPYTLLPMNESTWDGAKRKKSPIPGALIFRPPWRKAYRGVGCGEHRIPFIKRLMPFDAESRGSRNSLHSLYRSL